MSNLGSVTVDQMQQIDDYAVSELGLSLEMMMENAGTAIAIQSRRLLQSSKGKKILILAGSGHNGGDAIAAARRLHTWGAHCLVLLSKARDELKRATKAQLLLAEKYGVRFFEPGALFPEADLIIDGLIGYNLIGELDQVTADLIDGANRYPAPKLAIDLPSGLDGNTGKGRFPTIRADQTLTLAYPKEGLLKEFASQLVGRLFLADLGLPNAVWKQYGVTEPDFSQDIIIPLTD
ncbi:NAD(P)H-hydrate epimerase [Candidatus Berkelbacteria bacterium]|nr:NAD(P)H-hydrate epimerase [Candidatus Berkelbacteria bacterium]